MLCELFDVSRSCLYAYRQRRLHVDSARMALRSRVHELFVQSRSSAGSRSIMGILREQGAMIGRFKVGRLMDELGLICKQPGRHAYPINHKRVARSVVGVSYAPPTAVTITQHFQICIAIASQSI
jgi:hypothetical protein